MLLIRLKFENKICYKRKLHLFFVLIFYVFFRFYADSNTSACGGGFHASNIFLVFLF